VVELAIETNNLRMSFGRGKSIVKALNGIDFKIKKGENYCLLGPNGSGKTTLIRCILGLLEGEGLIYVLGHQIPYERNGIISEIGYMPQDISLYPDLSVIETMHFFGKIFGIYNKSKRNESIDHLLDIFLLKKWQKTRVDNLSGGMKRRLSLACTLVHDPKLLILDEPTVGVDPNLRIVFWDFFKELNEKGTTIITTTHVMDEAEKSRLIGFMRQGKLIAEGSFYELKKKIPEKRKLIVEVNLENPKQLADKISQEFASKTHFENFKIIVFYSDDTIVDDILSTIKKDTKIRSIQTIEPSLEDTFIFFSQENEKRGDKLEII